MFGRDTNRLAFANKLRSDDAEVEDDQNDYDRYDTYGEDDTYGEHDANDHDDDSDRELNESKQEESSSGGSERTLLNADDYCAVECIHCEQQLYHQDFETSSCDCCDQDFDPDDDDGSFSCPVCGYEICWNCWKDKRKKKVNILIKKLKELKTENKELSKTNSELAGQLLQLELSSVHQLSFATACARMLIVIDLIQSLDTEYQ